MNILNKKVPFITSTIQKIGRYNNRLTFAWNLVPSISTRQYGVTHQEIILDIFIVLNTSHAYLIFHFWLAKSLCLQFHMLEAIQYA